MSGITHIEGTSSGSGRRFGVVASRFHGELTDALVAGALDCLRRHQVEDTDVRVVRVPGAWEIPYGLDRLAARGGLDALIALGVLIRGETTHFDVIAREAAAGIAHAGREHGVPVGFGLLTCETSEQARARTGGAAGNKGWEAALAALEMADLGARLAS